MKKLNDERSEDLKGTWNDRCMKSVTYFFMEKEQKLV